VKHEELTERIIGAFFEVHSRLGYGFLEKVYENALSVEFEERGIKFARQVPIEVTYRGRVVGEYFADLVVDDLVIVEIKAVRSLLPQHGAQLLNYLKATRFEVGLLLNFGPSAKFVRKVFTNAFY
jgi:GxxExxY protein